MLEILGFQKHSVGEERERGKGGASPTASSPWMRTRRTPRRAACLRRGGEFEGKGEKALLYLMREK